MLIRRAVPDDAAAVTALHLGSRRAAYRGLMPDHLLDGPAVESSRARLWQERLGTPGPEARTWLALEAGILLGFAASSPSRDTDLDAARTAEVDSLYLDPTRIGQGIGRVLFAHTLDDLRGRGSQEVVLWVLESNAHALRFYARAGLAPGKHEVKVADGVDLPHVRWGRRL